MACLAYAFILILMFCLLLLDIIIMHCMHVIVDAIYFILTPVEFMVWYCPIRLNYNVIIIDLGSDDY